MNLEKFNTKTQRHEDTKKTRHSLHLRIFVLKLFEYVKKFYSKIILSDNFNVYFVEDHYCIQ